MSPAPAASPPRAPSGGARARLIPLAVFACVLALVAAHLPERLYGDDVFFTWCLVRGRVFTTHFLFMPIARAWCGGLARLGVDPFLALRLLAATATAGGVALLVAAARRRGASGALALGLGLCALSTSTAWFFAGAAEIHALQLCAFGLLAWVLAGLDRASSPARVLAAALAFGVAVGAHKTSVLLLPGVLAAYALATRGRAARDRARDAAAFALGGALALGLMLAAQAYESGGRVAAAAEAGLIASGLEHHLRHATPARVLAHWGEAWIAPAFALALLGAAAIGALWRLERATAAAATVALLPFALVLPLFIWTERGAYFLVTAPILAWTAARAALAPSGRARATDSSAHAPARPAERAAGVALGALAGIGALLRPEELLALATPLGLCALCALALAAGLALPRWAALAAPRLGALAVGLALAQAVGAQRELARYDASTPLLDWARDAVHATAPDARPPGSPDAAPPSNVLICTGFQQYMLLMLLDRPWPAPYADTWEFARALGTLGPTPFDVGAVAQRLEAGVAKVLDEGRRVFVMEPVFRHFEHEPLRGAHVRALKRDFDVVPVDRGAFHGFELLRRPR